MSHFLSRAGALVLFLLIFSFGIESPLQASHGEILRLDVPDSLHATEADVTAWKQLYEEIIPILESRYVRELSGAEIVALIQRGGIESVDPHSAIHSREEARLIRESYQDSFGGVGLMMQRNETGWGIRVVTPIVNGPAASAGVKTGDVIVEIDGVSTRDMTVMDAAKRLKGEPGTSVTFRVFRQGNDEPIAFTVTRAVIEQKEVSFELKENGYGYIRLSGFMQEKTPDNFRGAVDSMVERNGFRPLSGLIVDLRDNPGGRLDIVDALLDEILDRRQYARDDQFSAEAANTVSLEARGIVIERYLVGTNEAIVGDRPIIVLVNAGSASAPEIFAGVLQSHGRATVAGQSRTFGKGTAQKFVQLRDRGIFRITFAQYLVGPVGCEQAVQGVGIKPDILLRSEDENRRMFFEEGFSRAIPTRVLENQNCKYDYPLPEGHLAYAYDMLRVMALEPQPAE